MLGRSAYCERKLLDEIATGCSQYLIFADYNKNTPEHPMAAPVGVDYVFAVRE